MNGAVGIRLRQTYGFRPLEVGLGAAALALAVAVLSWQIGALVAVGVLLLGVAAIFLLAHPGWAVGVSAGALIVAESDESWGVPAFVELYSSQALPIKPMEVLMLLAVASVVLGVARPGHHARALRPFTIPLLLASVAILFGCLYGQFSGRVTGFQRVSTIQTVAPLFIFPFLIANVVDSRAKLRRVIELLSAVALVKALLGLLVVYGGLGTVNEGIGRLTYYEPASNYLLMLFLLAMLAARLQGIDTGRFAPWVVPVVLVCLTLSYRRTFWLATIACALLIIVVASRRDARRLLPFVAAAVVGAGYVVATGGYLGGGGEISERAESINPAKVSRNTQDRYRIAERKNVLLALEREPLTGLGVGVPWERRYPLPFDTPLLQFYAHFGLLWWWLKAGVLGGLAYLAIIGTSFFAGLRIWRRHPDPLVRAAGLAGGIGTVGFVIVELASSVIGPDQRGTAVFAMAIGLMIVAYRQCDPAGAPDRMRA